MKKLIPFAMLFMIFASLFSIPGAHATGLPELKFNTLINKTAGGDGVPAVLGAAANSRAAGLYQGRYVLAGTNFEGNKILVWDMENPQAAPTTLPLGVDIVDFGFRFFNFIRSVGNNIYVANMTLNASLDHPFRVYRWNSLTSTPEVILQYNGAAVRLGDAMNIIGDPATNGKIVVHQNTTFNFYVWTFENGVVTNGGNPEIITVEPSEVGIANLGSWATMYDIPGEPNRFVVTGSTSQLYVVDETGKKSKLPPLPLSLKTPMV